MKGRLFVDIHIHIELGNTIENVCNVDFILLAVKCVFLF